MVIWKSLNGSGQHKINKNRGTEQPKLIKALGEREGEGGFDLMKNKRLQLLSLSKLQLDIPTLTNNQQNYNFGMSPKQDLSLSVWSEHNIDYYCLEARPKIFKQPTFISRLADEIEYNNLSAFR